MCNDILFAMYDSGAGGLPYFEELMRERPDARCVYLGDNVHFPYGEKSAEQVSAYAHQCVQNLVDSYAPDVVVIACNTISVTALSSLRRSFPSVAFVGTVPAIKKAAELSKKRRIGLLATSCAINNPYTEKLIADYAADCYVEKLPAPELIDFIETRLTRATSEEIQAAIAPCMNVFRAVGVDVVVLACTHFLRITDEIQKAAGDDILIVDSREGVVHQALRLADSIAEQRRSGADSVDSGDVGASGVVKCAKCMPTEVSGGGVVSSNVVNCAKCVPTKCNGDVGASGVADCAKCMPNQNTNKISQTDWPPARQQLEHSILYMTGTAEKQNRLLADTFHLKWGGTCLP